MCTIGGVISGGRTLLLKNFDYGPVPTGWAHFRAFLGHSHFALVDHDQKGVNSGMNEAGLALAISRSQSADPESPEREELRTVLGAGILSGHALVDEAVEEARAYVAAHPEMYGGNLLLGDRSRISVVEHLAGRSCTETTQDGFLARANHFILGLADNATESSRLRHAKMEAFLESIHPILTDTDIDALFGMCRELLRSHPVRHGNTRSSMVMCPGELRIDYLVGSGEWRAFRFRP